MPDAHSLALPASLILIGPLAAFLVTGLVVRKGTGFAAGLISISLAAISWLSALWVAWGWWVLAKGALVAKAVEVWRFTWLPLEGRFHIDFSMILDPLGVMMLLVVTTIALLVNIYSMGYMKGDGSRGRFFALLSLFSFSMLGLVASGNLLQTYIFWEGVGVSSYLLIQFWYEKPEAIAASKKAFLLTRFADSFFLLGLVGMALTLGTLDLSALDTAGISQLKRTVVVAGVSVDLLFTSTLFVFIGAMGKSAMFPLHVWLPDAMEGPTPVSSIIHSATMVVAGVFLTARILPMVVVATPMADVVRVVGIFTALFAAVIACTQKDVKRILAYSTLSQLGYMMFALGSAVGVSGEVLPGAFTASTFHIFTHAFFKCMLFLGAGVVIHQVHSNNLENMGGLRKLLPLTHFSLLLATLAIAGIPPLSGFWSKDAILLISFAGGHTLTGALGLITGFLTAFYMFRFFFLTFYGPSRRETSAHGEHGHEDLWMVLPILALTIPTVVAGWLGHGFFEKNMKPLFEGIEAHHLTWLPYVATALGVGGMALAWWWYGRRGVDGRAVLSDLGRPAWYRLIMNKFHIDGAYLFVARKILIQGFAGLTKAFDSKVIDRSVDLSWQGSAKAGHFIRLFQNGHLSFYLGALLLGILLWRLVGGLPF